MSNNTSPFNSDRLFNLGSPDETYVSVRPTKVQVETPIDISFVIPIMNEEATIEELVERILDNVPIGARIEIILIDDGSTDQSWAVIQAMADLHTDIVCGYRFRSNRGKAAGLRTGFAAAKGEIVFTMDADLQDDPKEIHRFIKKIEEGYDLVSGWKAVRHDPWHKVLPSRIFNRMLSRFSRVKLHDHNCGFKCYRRAVVKSVHLFGELHRMVPSLAGMQGYKVAEIVVEHHARQFGKSKYGVERFIRGFSDMLTIGFLRVYRERPSHFTNACAGAYGSVAFLLIVVGSFLGIGSTLGVGCIIAALALAGMGGACVIAGLLSELMIRQQFAQQSASPVAGTTRQDPVNDSSANGSGNRNRISSSSSRS